MLYRAPAKIFVFKSFPPALLEIEQSFSFEIKDAINRLTKLSDLYFFLKKDMIENRKTTDTDEEIKWLGEMHNYSNYLISKLSLKNSMLELYLKRYREFKSLYD